MTRGVIVLALVAALAFVGVPADALPLTVQHLATDAEMLALLSDTLFVGEGRIGDGLGAATFEIDLGGDTGAPAQTAQYAWPNGGGVPWSLTYDHTTHTVSFTVDGINLQYVSTLSGFTDIFVRCRAVNAGSDILAGDLVLDGDVVGDASFADGDASGLDILWISGGTLADGFTLSGTTTMSWTGTMPTQSRLAFQIKVGKLKPVSTQDSSWGSLKARYQNR